MGGEQEIKMAEEEKHRKLKIAIDLASAVFVLYYVYCGVWAYHHPEPLGKHWPIQVVLLFCDGFPFAFGSGWFAFRIGDAIVRNFPIFKSVEFLLLLFGMSIAFLIWAKTLG